MRYRDIADLGAMITTAELAHPPIPKAALFLAGKAFQSCRKAGDGRMGVPLGLFIGAHAAVAGFTPITRDAGRYRTYFPRLAWHTPDRLENR